mmetsp:Transcript_97832/g.254979  ORF Transcript_97832/g.254979 Transcript_97832/m.254979 type:complete len:236 (+) Transcript_97832:786-1493(+)
MRGVAVLHRVRLPRERPCVQADHLPTHKQHLSGPRRHHLRSIRGCRGVHPAALSLRGRRGLGRHGVADGLAGAEESHGGARKRHRDVHLGDRLVRELHDDRVLDDVHPDDRVLDDLGLDDVVRELQHVLGGVRDRQHDHDRDVRERHHEHAGEAGGAQGGAAGHVREGRRRERGVLPGRRDGDEAPGAAGGVRPLRRPGAGAVRGPEPGVRGGDRRPAHRGGLRVRDGRRRRPGA